MKLFPSLAILLMSFFVACQADKKENQEADVNSESSEVITEENTEEVKDSTLFGESFDTTNAVTFTAALAQMVENDSLNLVICSEVQAVCQVKGCWMSIENEKEEMRVKFKDYAFFVPMDCIGSKAYMNGQMKKEVVTVAQQRHYLEDEEATEEEILAVSEDQVEWSFVASGVKFM